MSSSQPPSSHALPVPIARGARWVAQAVRRPPVAEALSWLVWLVSVLAFAFWTGTHYRATVGPSWLGMTIRTGVFALWTQVLREWIGLRLQRDKRQPADRQATRWNNDD